MATFETWDRDTLNRFAKECAADNQRLRTENAILMEEIRKRSITIEKMVERQKQHDRNAVE